MKERNNGTPKNKWSRIFRKKWFYPALYLVVAAALLIAVVWYENIDNQVPEAENNGQNTVNNQSPDSYHHDAKPVEKQKEVVKSPLEKPDQADIVTKFFDYDADQEDQKSALVLYNNHYYQSTGVDYATADDASFNVTAALSGKVTNVKQDPLLGNVVEITQDDITTYYASLGEVKVEAGDEVDQGDVVGTAGKNLYNKDEGNHLHFEIRKGNQPVNPETYINQSVSKLDAVKTDEVDSDKSIDNEEPGTSDKSDVTGDDATKDNATKDENDSGSKADDADTDSGSKADDADVDSDSDSKADDTTNNSDTKADDGETSDSSGSFGDIPLTPEK